MVEEIQNPERFNIPHFSKQLKRIEEPGLSRFYEFPGNPEKIIRKQAAKDSVEASTKYYSQLRDMFYRMRDNFGIKVPQMEMVLGEDEKGQQGIFMAVDKIHGKNLHQFSAFTPELARKLDQFYADFIDATLDAYKNKLPIWGDLNNSQLMFGKRQGENEDNIYISDVGSMMIDADYKFINPLEMGAEVNYKTFFQARLSDYFIRDWEARCVPAFRFEKSRKKLTELRKFMKTKKPAQK